MSNPRTDPVERPDQADSDQHLLASGVLPIQALQRAKDLGVIRSPKYQLPDGTFQPASIDLHLGDYAYRLQSSFLPGGHTVTEGLAQFQLGRPIDLRDGEVLDRNTPYLIPLIEELALPDGIKAKANPKSSTGRVDVFTRVITDRSAAFDEIRHGYSGRLYLELISSSFLIFVQTGLSLNQLRLFVGDEARCTEDDIRDAHTETPLLYDGDHPVPSQLLPVDAGGLFLGVDLEGVDGQPIAYKARKNSRLLNLVAEGTHQPLDFWEPIHAHRDSRLILERDEFYLLLSKELVHVPPDYAAEMVAYDPTAGELRTHYAGFFDPGFGHSPLDKHHGARAVLEVRARDVPFTVEHGQRLCKLEFEKMLAAPRTLYGEGAGSHYQRQTAMLSKHFRVIPHPGHQLAMAPESDWDNVDWGDSSSVSRGRDGRGRSDVVRDTVHELIQAARGDPELAPPLFEE